RIPREPSWPALTSSSLPNRTVIVVASRALAAAIDSPPAIDATRSSELHRETAPGEIVNAGGTFSTPAGSVFQTDEVGLKLRWPVSWGLRSASAVAYMNNVNW